MPHLQGQYNSFIFRGRGKPTGKQMVCQLEVLPSDQKEESIQKNQLHIKVLPHITKEKCISEFPCQAFFLTSIT